MSGDFSAEKKRRDAVARKLNGLIARQAETMRDLQTDTALAQSYRNAVTARAQAGIMGEAFNGSVPSVGESERLDAIIDARRQALKFADAQIPSLKLDFDHAEIRMKAAIGRHIRAETVPPLLEAAKRSFEVAMKDLARLAAAEDWANRLQATQSTDYIPSNASQFITGMLRGTARNVYFDAGPGRGAWDVPGYAEQSALVETAVRTMEAGE